MAESLRLLALTRFSRLGASSRLRTLQYVNAFCEAGIDVEVACLFPDTTLSKFYDSGRRGIGNVLSCWIQRLKDMKRASRFNAVWIEKEALPFLPSWVENLFLDYRLPVIVDYDDALFHRYDNHENRIIRGLLGRKIAKVMKQATVVVAGNEYLGAYARKAGCRRVEIVPTVVDWTRYQEIPRERSVESIRLGWIGTKRTAPYLQQIAEPLSAIQRESNVEVCLVGSGEITLHGTRVTCLDWTEDTEVQLLHDFDIGLMPLPDDPWAKGKCAYKLIQYMAASLPTIASPIGANCQVVEHGVTGYLASTTEDWIYYIRSLVSDSQRRHEMGIMASQKVKEHYNLDVTAPTLIDLIREVAV